MGLSKIKGILSEVMRTKGRGNHKGYPKNANLKIHGAQNGTWITGVSSLNEPLRYRGCGVAGWTKI